MRRDSSSDVAASEEEDERSITAVADEPGVTRERAPEIAAGDVLAGRYQIEAVLGKGGSGVVVRAFDRVSTTVVAVKVLKTALTHDPRWEKRFQRELRLGRPIQHPNVCRIFDIGDAEGYRFLTMEYAKGGTLRDLIKKDLPLRPLSERLKDAADAIGGLSAMHEAGIVHRDVKPDNMLRMDDGRLVLSDFGLATDLPDNTMVSVFVGTPHYMAPEVRDGDPATTRSDVWSLGVVLHEIFFGKRPERRASRTVSGVSKSSLTTTSSTIERAMLALCLRCLADDPAERPGNATAVRRLFENAKSSPHTILRSPRRRPLLLALLAIAAVAAPLGMWARALRRAQRTPDGPIQALARVAPSGEPADWSLLAKTIATVPARVHCFSMINPHTARLIWGTPRRAQDVDIDSGARRPAPLRPETYRSGCPQLSPNQQELLFTGLSDVGTTEIRLSKMPDGKDAVSLTPGREPAWLRNGEEFVYTLDAAHAAVFSLSTMSFRLLAAPGVEGSETILGKAVNQRGDAVAVLLYAKDTQWTLAIFEGPRLDHQKTIALPAGYEIQFDDRNDNVLVSHQVSGALSTLASLDWRRGTFTNLGHYTGLDLVDARFTQNAGVIVGRTRKTDVWLYDGQGRRKLTIDGESYSAAHFKDVLLVSRRTPDGTISIWSQERNGSLRQLTPGPQDIGPDISPDGHSWAYADYKRKSIMLCVWGGSCRTLIRDDMLPAWPRFSPDGRRLAFTTQLNPARLHFATMDGHVTQLGATSWQCPPVWTSPTRLWSFEGAGTEHYWSERDVETEARTGRRKKVLGLAGAPDEEPCWLADEPVESPFFQRLRAEAEEVTTLLTIPLGAPH